MMDPRELYAYDAWPSRLDQNWGDAARDHPVDQTDFHVDLGCGRLPKARIGVDRFACPGVGVMMDLGDFSKPVAEPREPGADALAEDRRFLRHQGLPFAESSIESIVSSHFFEHVGDGFIPLMEEVYRVLKPGGILRAITPLFPSWSSVSDPDHRRYFMATPNSEGGHATSWDTLCGDPGDEGSWLNSFSVPYTTARFRMLHVDYTQQLPVNEWWTWRDARELRVTLAAVK